MKKMLTAAVLAAALATASCAAKASGKKTVAYAIPGLSAPIWTAASEGFTKQAKALGWEAVLIDPNDNLENQITMVKNHIVKNIDGLVITPIDGQAVAPLMKELQDAKIPVVAIDRQVTGTSLTTIEADNFLIGKIMGELFQKQVGSSPTKVLIINGPLSSSATVNRINGFKSVASNMPNVKLIESSTEFDNELVLASALNHFQANPDIKAIFSCTDYLLPGVFTALKETGKLYKAGDPKHIFIYSVDGDGFGLQNIVDGYIDATFGLDPYEWAAQAVIALKDSFDGKPVSPQILISGRPVTAENFTQLKSEGVLWGASSMKAGN